MSSKYQNLYLTIISLIFFALLIYINTAHANGLIFSELMYNPEGSDTDQEWIEVYNNSTTSIEIDSNWRFNNGTNHLLSYYQGNNQIASNTFFIITSNARNFLNNHPNFNASIFESTLNLNNSGATIQLLNNEEIIDEFSYNSTLGGNGNNKSIEKIDITNPNNLWQESYVLKGTPGDYPSTPPANQSPIAIAGDDINSYLNEEILFDASNSYDPDNDELYFFWDIAGLASSTTVTTSYKFVDIGDYLVNLTVSDNQSSSTDSLIVTVTENISNDPPVIIVNNIDNSFKKNELIDFNACDSYDPQQNNLSFNWNFGDGGHASGCQNNYRYAQSGSYTVQLNVSNGNNTTDWNKDITIDAQAQIIINELLPNPEGSDNAEWIELKNLNPNNIVNLENWYIKDASGNKYIFTTNDFDDLNINDFFVIERSISNISLNNSNETIYLFNDLDEQIDVMNYSNSRENYSWARFNNQWQMTSILTKGYSNQKENHEDPSAIINLLSEKLMLNQELIFSAQNSSDPNNQDLQYHWYIDDSLKANTKEFKTVFTAPGLKIIKLEVINEDQLKDTSRILLYIIDSMDQYSSEENPKNTNHTCATKQEIIISEILPDPQGSDQQEWIELYNPHNQDLNLNNWTISDSSTNFKLKDTLAAKDYLIIKREDSKIALNNSNEEIRLFDCQQNLIWKLAYDKSFTEQSYAYDENQRKYFWTTTTSPGEKNTFSFSDKNTSSLNQEDSIKDSKIINNESVSTFIEIADIPEQREKDEVLINGIVVSLANELYRNTLYICYYDPANKISDLNECLAIYLKQKWPQLNYGDIVQIKGKVNHLKKYSRLKVEKAEDIVIINKNIPLNITNYYIEEINEDLINSLVSVSGQIAKLNKKSFYIIDDEHKLKIKINNNQIKLNDFSKNDFITVQGLIIADHNSIALVPRQQNDLIKSKILGDKEKAPNDNQITNKTTSANSSKTIDLQNSNSKNKGNKINWYLSIILIIIIMLIFRKNIIQRIKPYFYKKNKLK